MRKKLILDWMVILFFLCASSFAGYTILNSSYAPDAYVYARYGAIDNINREITYLSLINNTVIFDALTILGDVFDLTSPLEYLIQITILYCFIFVLKYIYIYRHASFGGALLILTISFFAYDINQLRFNLAVFFIIIASNANSAREDIVLKIFSGVSHVVPISMYIIRRFNSLIVIFGSVLFFAIFKSNSSRLLLYADEANGVVAFKSLLYFLPVAMTLILTAKKKKVCVLLMIAQSFFAVGIFMIPLDTALSARFAESAFLFCALWWVFYSKNKFLGFVFWAFAIASFFSRYVSGINAGENDFIF